MLQTIGELLPLAVGISISPLPIIAMIVLLMSPNARTSTPVFMAGWMLAIAVVLVLVGQLSGLGLGGGMKGNIAAYLRLAVGGVMLFFAYKEWRARPAPGETGKLPHWLEAVEHMKPLAAAGLGFGIYAANPKNLTVGIAAGIIFGSAHLPIHAGVVVCIVYVLIAASTVYIPVAAYFLAEKRVRPKLDEMRVWLAQHNAAVMATLLLVIGAMMVGKGIGGLT